MPEALKLFGSRLLVKEFTTEAKKGPQKSESGKLWLPETQQNPMERLFRGEVMGVGDECTKVKVGQTIIYDKMQPAPFKVGEEIFEMLDESAIIGAYVDAESDS